MQASREKFSISFISSYNNILLGLTFWQWREKSTSCVIRISVRRGRCAVGVKGRGVVEGAGQLPEKNIPKMISLGAFFPQFLTGRKHGSLGTRILQFNREITKLTKTVQNYPKIHDQTKVAVAPSPPVNTPLKSSLHSGAGNCHA